MNFSLFLFLLLFPYPNQPSSVFFLFLLLNSEPNSTSQALIKVERLSTQVSILSSNASKWRRCHWRRRRRKEEGAVMELFNYFVKVFQTNRGCKLKAIMATRFKITRLPMYLIRRWKRKFWSFLERLRLRCGIGSDEQKQWMKEKKRDEVNLYKKQADYLYSRSDRLEKPNDAAWPTNPLQS